MASFQLKGVEGLIEKLDEFKKSKSKAIIRKGMREAAKIVLPSVENATPVKTGELQTSLQIKPIKRNRKGWFGVKIETYEGDWKGQQFYAPAVEYGHFSGKREMGFRRMHKYAQKFGKKWVKAHFGQDALGSSRKFVPGVHFMKKGFASSADMAMAKAIEVIKAGIEKELKWRRA